MMSWYDILKCEVVVSIVMVVVEKIGYKCIFVLLVLYGNYSGDIKYIVVVIVEIFLQEIICLYFKCEIVLVECCEMCDVFMLQSDFKKFWYWMVCCFCLNNSGKVLVKFVCKF